MKKVISLFITLGICFSICACMGKSAKSSAAIRTDELIASIGIITLESKEIIEEAELFYEALTEKQKEEIENRITLLQARKAFDELEKKSKTITIDLTSRNIEEYLNINTSVGTVNILENRSIGFTEYQGTCQFTLTTATKINAKYDNVTIEFIFRPTYTGVLWEAETQTLSLPFDGASTTTFNALSFKQILGRNSVGTISKMDYTIRKVTGTVTIEE